MWSESTREKTKPNRQSLRDNSRWKKTKIRPQPSICIYQPWLIRIGNNKSQRLHIIILSSFLLSNSFVTSIGFCSLLLLLSQVVVINLLSSAAGDFLPVSATCFRNRYQKCSIKKLFLKVSQYSLEKTCIGVSF